MNMTATANFEVIISFHCWAVSSDGLQKRTVTEPQDYRAGKLISFCVHCFLKAWKELLSKSAFTDSFKTMAPNMIFENSICQFQCFQCVLKTCYSCRSSRHWWVFVVRSRVRKVYVLLRSIVSANTYYALRYVTCLMFVRHHLLILTCNLYQEGEDWSELFQCILNFGKYP